MFINLMVALGLLFLTTYRPLPRLLANQRGRDVAVASVMSVFCMLYPWYVGPGQMMDFRMVPLGLVGWRYGTAAAAAVGAVILGFRLVPGGSGVITTVVYVLGSVALVPLYHKRPHNWLTLAAVGVAQTVVGYAGIQFLLDPVPAGLEYDSPFWLMRAAVQVLGFWALHAADEHVRERQQLQRHLADALRSREAVLELIPQGIVFLDEQGRIKEMNHAARALLKGDVLPDAIRTHLEVQQALQQRTRCTGCRVTVPDGECGERIVLVSALPLQGGGMVLGLENVTTVVHEEREQAQHARLELLGRMAAMAAHEIRNPLTTIKGFLQLLGGKAEFQAHRSTMALVQSEVEHINRVVSDFLELSGNQNTRVLPLSLDAALHEVLAAIALQFPESEVTVQLTGEAGLTALADQKSLKQILRNLLVNAYEAMPEAGRITVRRQRLDGGVLIAVSDTGHGISADVMGHIFTPYTTTKTTGTGLGLAISHKLAVDMGAHLTAESTDGVGSTFRLVLPAPASQALAAAGIQPPEPQA
jgi:signal transduction histidine kinase